MSAIKVSTTRKKTATKIIRRRMLYAAGLGLIPIPIVDAVSILSTQVLMVKELSKLYEIPFKENRAKSFIGALVGSFGMASIIKVIPGLGSAIGGAAVSLTGIAATYAIGKVFTQHFDQGGTLLDFDPVKSRKYFQEAYDEGKIEAEKLQAESISVTKKAGEADDSNIKQGKSTDAAKKKALKEKQLKAMKASRRKRRRWKWFKRFLFLLLLGAVIGFYFYIQQTKHKLLPTDLDAYMKSHMSRKIDLQAIEPLDSATTAQIAAFTPGTTESTLEAYIQSANASYPKIFALNAVQFMGSSETLRGEAKEQLTNIVNLMKKYPNLIVNMYAHTAHTGSELNQARIGRNRARAIKGHMVMSGVFSERVKSSFIQKKAGEYNEYWGVEMVVDVSEENAPLAK